MTLQPAVTSGCPFSICHHSCPPPPRVTTGKKNRGVKFTPSSDTIILGTQWYFQVTRLPDLSAKAAVFSKVRKHLSCHTAETQQTGDPLAGHRHTGTQAHRHSPSMERRRRKHHSAGMTGGDQSYRTTVSSATQRAASRQR